MRSNTSAKCVSQSAAFLFLLLSLFVPNVSFAQNNDLSEMGLLRKQQAINKLGNRLAAVAAKHGKSPSELRRMFLQDSTLHIDKNDRLLYVEAEPDAAEIAALEAESSPQAAPYSYSNTFALHSRPSSPRKIYLDFNGHTISPANAWSYRFSGGVAAPFNLDNDPNSFSAAEQDVIQNIWLRISEDYAPFDVDVTTEDPGGTVYGTRAVMTPTNFMGAGIGGVAFMGAFGGPEDFQPAWVFTGGWGSSDKGIAEAASHEIGHNLGLDHDGNSFCTSSPGCGGYYSGHGVWAPIMGVGYSKSVTHWSKGEYPGATTQEDDLAIMQRYAPLIADDYGNTIGAARSLSGTNINISGLITTRDDVDVFRFTTGSGNISININSAPRGANLDIKAQILDSAGNVIATSDPSCFSMAAAFPAGMSATFNQFLSAGTYYLTIDGVGNASDDTSAGYSDYASLGQYNIIGTLGAGGGSQPQPPVAVVSASSLSGTAPLNVSFFSTGSNDPDGSIVSYAWNFGDGTGSTAQNPSKIYYSAGTFTASLTVTDNSGLTGTRSVLITVTNPAAVPSIAGTVFYGNTPAGQSTKYVSGVLMSANSAFFASTNANGSYLLDNLIAGGAYTVTPSKTGNVNGITSFDATLVLRHVASGGFGTNALNANQQLAADTNNSGDITSFDATQILRYVAANGANANTGDMGTWRFSPAPRSYNSVYSSITNQNYEAVLVGDINGNWSPTGSGIISGEEKERQEIAKWQKQETREFLISENAVFKSEQSAKTEFNVNAETAQQQAQISLPINVTGQNGSTVLIPVTLTNTGTPIVAYTIEISFDPNVLQAPESLISTANTLSDPNAGAMCQVFSGRFNTGNRTTLRMAAACNNNITASGTLLNLRFNVVGTANTATATTTLEFTVRSGADPLPNFESESGTIPVVVTNGSFTVVSTPIASVTVAGRVLTAGGRGLRNAQIRLTAADGSSKTVMSGPFGDYRFANVQAGQSVTIQVISKRFGFQPQTVNVSGDISGLNFVAQP